jgi:hypothetical protein
MVSQVLSFICFGGGLLCVLCIGALPYSGSENRFEF